MRISKGIEIEVLSLLLTTISLLFYNFKQPLTQFKQGIVNINVSGVSYVDCKKIYVSVVRGYLGQWQISESGGETIIVGYLHENAKYVRKTGH